MHSEINFELTQNTKMAKFKELICINLLTASQFKIQVLVELDNLIFNELSAKFLSILVQKYLNYFFT